MQTTQTAHLIDKYKKNLDFLTVDRKNLDLTLQKLWQEKGNAFYVIDLERVKNQLALWRKCLPQSRPYYAVKCNPDPVIWELLQQEKIGFDCASKGEIEQVQRWGVEAKDIIFANPCKHPQQIDFAQKNSIHTYTFDCIEELEKIHQIDKNARLVLRLKTDDSNSLCRFSTKFGAELSEITLILEKAKMLNVNFIGTSFHVGSGCRDAESYQKALIDCKKVFDQAKKMGFKPYFLDIGGGFPGFKNEDAAFEKMAETIQNALKTHFSEEENLEIIGEPGRFLVAASHTLYVNITSKKAKFDSQKQEKNFVYYINEAVYASFNCLFFDHYQAKLLPFKKSEKQYLSTVFGQTCDSLDKIVENIWLPELEIGDWFKVENFGAYTIAPASTFNGFDLPDKYYLKD